MQESSRLSESSRSADQEVAVEEVKSRIVAEIENAIKRARENPSMYDKGSYYKYSKS